jgi:hypothetical protein
MKLKISVVVACFLPGRAKNLSAPLFQHRLNIAGLHETVVFNLVSSEGGHDSCQTFTFKMEEESSETSLSVSPPHISEELNLSILL